jgi:hypothetical protein
VPGLYFARPTLYSQPTYRANRAQNAYRVDIISAYMIYREGPALVRSLKICGHILCMRVHIMGNFVNQNIWLMDERFLCEIAGIYMLLCILIRTDFTTGWGRMGPCMAI